ncbi:hypothetical protein Barb6XT_02834 [Bacteroidales bacterium Barb6XT]|nr:hypothetical protein Barb6XT_02834 [Bacteroidales bacterium Barb6XT]
MTDVLAGYAKLDVAQNAIPTKKTCRANALKFDQLN